MTIEQVQLPLILISGVLGSAHCIGMCGAIAVTMSAGASSWRTSVGRQFVWSLGRTSTYTFLGITAASVGAGFGAIRIPYVSSQALFAILAGLLLVGQGLVSAGLWPRRLRSRPRHSCVATSVFAQFLRGGSMTGAFIAGLLTGFLPCGLVYSFLALAASSAHPGQGALIMLTFGAGTVPVMLATGIGVSLINLSLRRRLFRIAACCVLVTGVLTIGRGVVFARSANGVVATGAAPTDVEGTTSTHCPMCAD